MQELVSVIIPCYNAEKTLGNAIKSVVEQTYENIEIVIVNDGSLDGSEDVALEWKKTSAMQIHFYTQKNMGVSCARNKGIEMANGKYILFLDADDMISPDMVKVLVNGIERKNADTAYCTWTHGDFDEDIKCEFAFEDTETLLKKQMLKRKYRVGFYNYLYIKDILIENKITFPCNLAYGEDGVFVMKYLLHCKRGASIGSALYQYTVNPSSVMNSANWRMTDNLKGIIEIQKSLIKNEIYDLYCEYAYPRAVWALAKDFAAGNRWDLLEQLENEYFTRENMKKLIQMKQIEVFIKITAFIYTVNSKLFFIIIKIIMKK